VIDVMAERLAGVYRAAARWTECSWILDVDRRTC